MGNFEFLRECRMESEELQAMYDAIGEELERAEREYRKNPGACGVILRGVAEQICRVYNLYYEIGCPQDHSLEQFLCYTQEEAHNVQVSRFLSAVRKEQRDRLNRLRVLGDDCIWGEDAPDGGMTSEDRMAQNARRMMDTVTETLKGMCARLNGRDDLGEIHFAESRLPGQDVETTGAQADGVGKKGLIRKLFSRKN